MDIIESRRGLGIRMICFAVSLLIHVVGIYIILTHKFTYRMYPMERRIRYALLVPPDKVFLPRDIYGAMDDLSGEIYAGPGDLQPVRSRSSAEAGMEREDRALSPMTGSGEGEEAGLLSSHSGTPFRFSLSPSGSAQTEESVSAGLDLSAGAREGKGTAPKGPGKDVPADVDFGKYVLRDFSEVRSSRRNPFYRSRRFVQGAGREGISLDMNQVDLAPWAQKVVERIQKNWTVADSQDIGIENSVRIALLLKKNGELTSLELLESSDTLALDQAAVRAINMSRPFPPLPKDYPLKTMEVVLQFQYERK